MTEVRVSPLPVFDFEKALLAKEKTYSGFRNTPNVRTAGSLWLYNTPPRKMADCFEKITFAWTSRTICI